MDKSQFEDFYDFCDRDIGSVDISSWTIDDIAQVPLPRLRSSANSTPTSPRRTRKKATTPTKCPTPTTNPPPTNNNSNTTHSTMSPKKSPPRVRRAEWPSHQPSTCLTKCLRIRAPKVMLSEVRTKEVIIRLCHLMTFSSSHRGSWPPIKKKTLSHARNRILRPAIRPIPLSTTPGAVPKSAKPQLLGLKTLNSAFSSLNRIPPRKPPPTSKRRSPRNQSTPRRSI